jgi:hypothetical protein
VGFVHLKDESILCLYENIRSQVDAERGLTRKFMTGKSVKQHAADLREEQVRRRLQHNPRAEGETIGDLPMVDLVDFHERLRAKQAEDRKYLERLDLTAKMIPVMVETVETFAHMGACREHIVLFLQATIEELQG